MTRFLTIAVGLVVILVLTLAAFGLDVTRSLGLIWEGAVGDNVGLSRTLVKFVPLLLTALGILVAWRAKMFNIGGEGQWIVGGIFAASVFKLMPNLPPGLLNVMLLAAGAAGGALFAGLAAVLQIKRGVQVVISTILLNFIAVQGLEFAIRGPLQQDSGTLPMTQRLPNEVMLARFNAQTDLHAGIFIALLAVLAVWIFMTRTRAGFDLRVVGESETAARANGINVARNQMRAMMISGGLCGLASAVEYTGMTGQLSSGFAQSWGFLAIPVALLGNLSPLGTAASSLFFSGLLAGSENLGRFTGVGTTVVLVIQGAAVLAYIALDRYKWRPLARKEAT